MTTPPPPEAGDLAAPTPDDEAACRQAAKRLREKYPRWVVIWVPRTARYHAYPLASSRAGTGLADTGPAGLAAKIEQAERDEASRRAAPPRQLRSKPAPSDQAGQPPPHPGPRLHDFLLPRAHVKGACGVATRARPRS